MKNKLWAIPLGILVSLAAYESSAKAALLTSYQFNGKGNWSIDGVGSNNTPVGILDAFVPAGSTVEAAFLYSSLYSLGRPTATPTVVLDGITYDASNFVALGDFNPSSSLTLGAYRADVTSQVASKVGTGGGTFNFTVDSENPNSNIDGEILAVVYSNPLEQERTIAFLDGFSSSGGDTTTVNLSQPLDITTPGFEALLSLGIGFGFQGGSQFSTVDVDGRRLTSSAGGQDDGVSSNGGLITVGGLGDSTANPSDPFANPTSSSSDDELYNLAVGNSTNPAPFLTSGATSFDIDTENPSLDDNLFFLGINITAEANINAPIDVPEPSTIIGLLAIGFGGSLLKKKVHKA
ncbi:MAG: PEP-CTERM sorting domain-containing protein [Cyanobacteriota bacterium]|nr:PEP-CTERM sorting domain-containing protein [Cyanobacteriota bacterium]